MHMCADNVRKKRGPTCEMDLCDAFVSEITCVFRSAACVVFDVCKCKCVCLFVCSFVWYMCACVCVCAV